VVKSPLTIANENKTVKAGEDLIYIMEMDKRMALPCVITKQLIDGTVKTFSPIIGNMDVGKSAYRYSVKVPLYTAPGENILRWSGAYKVNPMRWVTVVVESEPFQIIASEKQ